MVDTLHCLQLILSLAVLILCFLVTTISTIAIVLITRARRQHSKKKVDTPSPTRSSPLIETKPTRGHRSPGVDRQLQSGARKQADSGNDSGNYSANMIINLSGRLPDPSWYEPSSSVWLSSSDKDDVKQNLQAEDNSDDEVSEEMPLLSRKHEISPEPTTLGFGEMSESTGVWHRDASGKHLTRFVVLHMFLIFSMLMVGTSKYY